MSTRPKILLVAAMLLLAVSLGSVASPRQAAAGTEIDVSVFYGALAPHGEWIQLQPYGWAWVPDNVDYAWRPYTVGQWVWVEPYGWTWASEEPWGWATYHYGRWTYVEEYGWAWVPGTTWGPAWVAFRFGNPWVGWAPLPPGVNWRFDAGLDLAGLNLEVSIGTFAWTFVSLRYFAEPDLRPRYVAANYNPYLLERTQWSTRYASVEGGVSNRGVEVADVERARRAPIPRRRLREAQAPGRGSGVHVEGDAVELYRPRIAPTAPLAPPVPRVRGPGPGTPPRVGLDAWTAQRQAALKAHLEAQRKALEERDAVEPEPVEVQPRRAPDDAAKRREAALKALEEERKRLEALLDRQRRRLERELEQQEPAPLPPRKPDDSPSKKDKKPGKKDENGADGAR